MLLIHTNLRQYVIFMLTFLIQHGKVHTNYMTSWNSIVHANNNYMAYFIIEQKNQVSLWFSPKSLEQEIRDIPECLSCLWV